MRKLHETEVVSGLIVLGLTEAMHEALAELGKLHPERDTRWLDRLEESAVRRLKSAYVAPGAPMAWEVKGVESGIGILKSVFAAARAQAKRPA